MGTYEDVVESVIKEMVNNGSLTYGQNGSVIIPDEISSKSVFDGLILRVGVHINDELDQKLRLHRVRGYAIAPEDIEKIIFGYCPLIVRRCADLLIDVSKNDIIRALERTVNIENRKAFNNE